MYGRVARQGLHLVMLVLSVVTYVFQLVIGILLVISPRDHGQVYNLAHLETALFAVALSRAWALVQGRHLRPSSHPETSRPAPPDTSLSALSASRTSTDQQGGGSCYQPPAAAAAQLPSQAS
jgi:hypothetical protein